METLKHGIGAYNEEGYGALAVCELISKMKQRKKIFVTAVLAIALVFVISAPLLWTSNLKFAFLEGGMRTDWNRFCKLYQFSFSSRELMERARPELKGQGCSDEQNGRFACDGFVVVISDGSAMLLMRGGVGPGPGSAAIVSRTRETVFESLLVKAGLIEGPLKL